MKQFNYQTGRQGEKLAEKYLRKKGYKILARNFRLRFGEIDLVAADGKTIVFVEVKTKTGEQFGEPWEMINQHKLEQIKKMGRVYLIKQGMNEAACRIDVLGVWLRSDGGLEKIKHWQAVV
jgi:putative endonuclease